MTSFICHSTCRLVSATRLSLFSLALAAGVVFSQSALAVDPSPAPSATNTEATTTTHHPDTSHHNFKGTVTAVSSTSLTVAKKKTGEMHTFQLSSETTVSMSQHVQGSLSNLAVGQYVLVQSSPDWTKALHIHVRNNHENKSKTACNCHSCPGNTKEHHDSMMTSPSSSDKKANAPSATN